MSQAIALRKHSRQLSPRAFESIEFAMAIYRVEPELGVEPEDLLDPSYWAHVASRVAPGSLIYAVPTGNGWFAEYYVTSVEKLGIQLKLLRAHRFDEQVEKKEAELKDYFVKWGGMKKYIVVRKKDNAPVKEDLPNREAAILAAMALEKNDLM